MTIIVIADEAVTMVEIITMEEAAIDPMATTTMVDSVGIILDTREMDIMSITTTMGSLVQILNLGGAFIKCYASSATTRGIMQMTAQRRRLKQVPSPIPSRRDMLTTAIRKKSWMNLMP